MHVIRYMLGGDLMAATVTDLGARRPRPDAEAPTVRRAVDAFLAAPRNRASANTQRAYAGILDRLTEQLGADRPLAEVSEENVAAALDSLWGESAPATWNRNRAAVGSWLRWCATTQRWATPQLPPTVERRRENNDSTKSVDRATIDRLCRRRDVPLRERTLWRMLYETASRASAVLALNVEDLDLPNKRARIVQKGGDTMWIAWGTDTAHLLPRLIAGRTSGPLFLSERKPGPHQLATTDARDIDPETGHVRLGYDRARILLGRYSDGLRLHQLRHSAATHLGEANVSTAVIMAKTGHKSLRSVQRYVKPGIAAVAEATELLSSPTRRG
ncbi:tyrosine-type recombinase/integrase [Mycobacteroides abscessus]